jgi:hypothetical protein
VDPRRLLPVLTAVACACVVATLAVSLSRESDRAQQGRPVADVAPSRPAEILAAWDERRSEAWAEGSTEALRRLYAAGSRTGAADVRLLRRYLARGLVVEGMATQVLALGVVERGPERWVLVVTDRVVGARAVGGASPVALPADRASTRRIVLVRAGEEWVVAEARDQASAAASTSRTSSSSKS